MRKLTAALCALALFAPAAQAQTIKDFLAAVTKKWTAPFEPFQLIGNIYYVGTDGIAVYVIKTSQGLILMDTALAPRGILSNAPFTRAVQDRPRFEGDPGLVLQCLLPI